MLTDLGTLGGKNSGASWINERGQVVGWSKTKLMTETGDPIPHGFLWENGTMRDLGPVKRGGDSDADSINDQGQIVGTGWANGITYAFLWEDGSMHLLHPGTNADSYAAAINNRGQILGTIEPLIGESREVIWDKKKLSQVRDPRTEDCSWNDINDRGDLVGTCSNREEEHAVLWHAGKIRDLGTLGGSRSVAWAINERGQVVGFSDTEAEGTHAFLWEDGNMRDLGTLGASEVFARDINDRGQVVGEARTTERGNITGSPITHAFLWQNGKMIDLGGPGTSNSDAKAINDRGQIVGSNGHAAMWTWQPAK